MSAMRIPFYIALILLAGCMQPTVKASNEGTVVLSGVTKKNIDTALSLADSECSKHGKHAVYKADDQPDGYANFECAN